MKIDIRSIVDTVPSKRWPVYTRANVTDVWPGPATPLNFTTTSGSGTDIPWRRALARLGGFDLEEFEGENGELASVFWGYPYLNLSAQRVYGLRMPGGNVELVDQAFFGKGAEDVPAYEPDVRDVSPQHTDRILKSIEWVMSVDSIPHLDVTRAEILERKKTRPVFGNLSERQLFDHAEQYLGAWLAREMEEHMFIISAGSIPVGAVQSAAVSAGDAGLSVRALGGLGNVDSAAPTIELWDISRLVRVDAELKGAFDSGVIELIDRIEGIRSPASKKFLTEFDRFLGRHGSRCTNEYDYAEEAWETNPLLPLTAIDRMRHQADDASPRDSLVRLTGDRDEAVSLILRDLDDDTQDDLAKALSAARIFLQARERSKTNLILMIHEARLALHELGRRMVKAGHFSELSDFTFLRIDEFLDFLDDPASYRKVIVDRKEWYSKIAELEPPFVTVGLPAPPSKWRRRSVEHLTPASIGEVIEGVGSCAGSATGRARVLHSPIDASDLQPGDILIAASTDPSWTPLFLSASAVVVDVGAPMSHASIVSRELGIPCVVSARHASRRIPDGALIHVDGAAGTVTMYGS